MPWDHSNVRSWELSKAAPRIGLSAYRSGLYKRAIVVLQDQSCDSAGRATAKSLQEALSNAHANCTAGHQPALPEQAETNSAGQQQQSSLDKKNQRQKEHHAKLLIQSLRRQRQQQRHEQNKLLWQQRHEQKIKLRQEQFELQVKMQRQQQDEAMQRLEHQKEELCQNLQQHKQDVAAAMEATKSEAKNLVAASLEKLNRIQEKKATAEEQLAKV